MIKKIFKGFLFLILLLIVFLAGYNYVLTFVYDQPIVTENLSDEDIKELKFVYEIKDKVGNDIWPGFGSTPITQILFNNKFEFVAEKEVLGKSNIAELLLTNENNNPQAFAVRMNNQWMGSLGTVDQMNREMFWGIRKEVPPPFNFIFPYMLIKISRDIHVSSTMHEMFHAFEAISNEQKFLDAEDAHKFLHDYPYHDPEFRELWNKEGQFLNEALNAENQEALIASVKSFLEIRSLRREGKVSKEQIDAEKKLEWLEGLAKYVEYKTYIAAANMDNQNYNFKKKNAYWQLEQKQGLKGLGNSDSDRRFYISGSSLAFILDKLDPSWKGKIMSDSIYLEDLIEDNLTKTSKL